VDDGRITVARFVKQSQGVIAVDDLSFSVEPGPVTVLQRDWVLTVQVVVPTVASAVMISTTKTFDQGPAAWVGAVVLLAFGLVLGGLGVATPRRRDIA